MNVQQEPSGRRRSPSDWKTALIVVLGAAAAGAWLFVWGLHLIRGGRTALGTALLMVAVLLVPLGRRLLSGGGQWREDARQPRPRQPWHW